MIKHKETKERRGNKIFGRDREKTKVIFFEGATLMKENLGC